MMKMKGMFGIMVKIFFKVIFSCKYIKIIFIFYFLKFIFDKSHQNKKKIEKK